MSRLPLQPTSSSMRQVAGVACMIVSGAVSTSLRSRRPSRTVSRSTSRIRAPTVSGATSSVNAISKDSVLIAQMVSASVRPGSRAIERIRFTAERCRISTPFGLPVEPEVKMTYAGSSGPAAAPCGGASAEASSGASASTTTTDGTGDGTVSRSAVWVTITLAADRLTMYARRSTG